MKLLMATQNTEKVKDFQDILKSYAPALNVELIAVPKGTIDPEEGDTSLLANSAMKAAFYGKMFSMMSVGDDTGFFIPSLRYRPGVIAKRWAEETNETLWGKTLRLLGNNKDRNAWIESIISIFLPEQNKVVSTLVKIHGTIAMQNTARPDHFGYRGIFIPNGSKKTYAEMTPEERLNPNFNSRSAGFLKLMKEI